MCYETTAFVTRVRNFFSPSYMLGFSRIPYMMAPFLKIGLEHNWSGSHQRERQHPQWCHVCCSPSYTLGVSPLNRPPLDLSFALCTYSLQYLFNWAMHIHVHAKEHMQNPYGRINPLQIKGYVPLPFSFKAFFPKHYFKQIDSVRWGVARGEGYPLTGHIFHWDFARLTK